MPELWWPKAKRDPFADGGSFTGGPPKGLLHTTEGYSYEGARSVYASKAVAPHFTVSHQRGYGEAWQHVPINRASRALRNASGGVQTNRDSVVQLEIVGFARYAHELPRYYLDFIASLMRWNEANASVPRRSDVTWVPYPQSYGMRAAQRLSATAWDNYSGWLGHQHVPEGNAHGDPGLIDIAYLLGRREEEDVYVDLGPEHKGGRNAVSVPLFGETELVLATDRGDARVRVATGSAVHGWDVREVEVPWGRTLTVPVRKPAELANLEYKGGTTRVGVRVR